MILCVHLPDYGKELSIEFTVTINQCVVYKISVTHPQQLSYTYQIDEPTLVIPVPQAFLTPSNCGQ